MLERPLSFQSSFGRVTLDKIFILRDIDAIMFVPTVISGGEQGGSPLAQGRQLFLDVSVEEKESRMIFVESRVNDNAQVVLLFVGHLHMKANNIGQHWKISYRYLNWKTSSTSMRPI